MNKLILGEVERQWFYSTTNDNKRVFSFGNGYQIVMDMNTDTAYKTKDGETIEKFSIEDISWETLDQLLINF
jgi:hypothetical protein